MGEVKQSHFFKSWTTGSRDAVGNASTPIELLALGVLNALSLFTKSSYYCSASRYSVEYRSVESDSPS